MIFRKTVIEHRMWVLIFSANVSEKSFIPRKFQRDSITNLHESSRKVSIILVRFSLSSNLHGRFSKKHTSFKLYENLYSGSGVF